MAYHVIYKLKCTVGAISPAQFHQICRKNLRNFTIFSWNTSCANIAEWANIAEFFWDLYLKLLSERHKWRHFQD